MMTPTVAGVLMVLLACAAAGVARTTKDVRTGGDHGEPATLSGAVRITACVLVCFCASMTAHAIHAQSLVLGLTAGADRTPFEFDLLLTACLLGPVLAWSAMARPGVRLQRNGSPVQCGLIVLLFAILLGGSVDILDAQLMGIALLAGMWWASARGSSAVQPPTSQSLRAVLLLTVSIALGIAGGFVLTSDWRWACPVVIGIALASMLASGSPGLRIVSPVACTLGALAGGPLAIGLVGVVSSQRPKMEAMTFELIASPKVELDAWPMLDAALLAGLWLALLVAPRGGRAGPLAISTVAWAWLLIRALTAS